MAEITAVPGQPGDYEIHPLAELFPIMTDAELNELGADILAHGLREPIIIYEGKVGDGRCRYLAAKKVGHQFKPEDFKRWKPTKDGGTFLDYVTSRNLHRRHLTTSQRAAIGADIANLKNGETKVAKEGEGAGTSIDVAPTAPVAQKEAAETMKVSVTSVQRAAAVKKADPELHKKVKDGKISLNKAHKQAKAKKGSGKKGTTKKTMTPSAEPKDSGSEVLSTDWKRATGCNISQGKIWLDYHDGGLWFELTLELADELTVWANNVREAA